MLTHAGTRKMNEQLRIFCYFLSLQAFTESLLGAAKPLTAKQGLARSYRRTDAKCCRDWPEPRLCRPPAKNAALFWCIRSPRSGRPSCASRRMRGCTQPMTFCSEKNAQLGWDDTRSAHWTETSKQTYICLHNGIFTKKITWFFPS